MGMDEDVEAAERWEVIQKIEKTERKISFGDICVGVLGRGAWEEMVGEN